MEKEEKTLTQKQRRLLQVGVVILLALFLGLFFYLCRPKQETQIPKLKNTSVYLTQSNLQVFDDKIDFAYPDKLSIHYPYLLLVKTNMQTTYIYNLDQKNKEQEIKELLLDYTNGNQLILRGNTTYLNNQDLGILCEKGFIKSADEILCVTKVNKNSYNYKLVSINPNTKKQQDLYTSPGIITDVKVINSKTYIGEINTLTKANRLLIDNQPITVPNVINIMYSMNNQIYFVSLPSSLNKNTLSSYLINENNVQQQSGDKVYLVE